VTSVKDLKSDHKNARRRTDRSASLIAESLKRFGAARSIVIDEDGRILAGNGTVEGAKKQASTSFASLKPRATNSLPFVALALQKTRK
jgi:hypothetical protein